MGLSSRTPAATGLSFRPAEADDLERLIDVHTSAFPDARGREARARNFTRNPLGALEDLWVALSSASGAIVGHAFLFPLKAWFGGALVPVGGVATVGVAPEARGRGIGSALVEHLHAVSHARGDALTVLYPYRQAFYARLGYAAVSTYRRLRIAPSSVPWGLELRPRAATGADRTAMRRCWEETGARRSGTLARTERSWDARLSDDAINWLVVEGGSGVEGYVAWSLLQTEAHAATTMLVREMCARTDVATRSLWALIGRQRGQVSEVRVDVASDDPVERALIDADGARHGDAQVEHALGEVAAGPVIRMVDPRRALEARGYSTDGRLCLALGHETLELRVREGRAALGSPSGESEGLVRVDPIALAAVAFGALPASQAHRFGWLEARDGRSLALADELLSLPPYFSPDPF